VEVEIFNAEVWDAPPDQTAATVRERFATVLGRNDNEITERYGVSEGKRHGR